MSEETRQLLNQDEVAEMLGVSSKTVYRLRLAGKIPYVRVSDRRIMFREADIQQYIRDNLTQESIPEPSTLDFVL